MRKPMDAVRGALKEAGLLHPGAKLLCAVSGGHDSVALLHALCAVRAEMPFTLQAVHVQHGLRGEASCQDEAFVRRLCEEWQVPLSVENAGLNGDMHTPGIETRARECRRAIFRRIMEAGGMDALLTAHHRDDQAETVLMHLFRGAGAEGLRGMQRISPFGPGVVIRPFLALGRGELGEFEHCEDESNRQPVTARNALRLEMMPALERWFPGADGHIAQAAETLQADEAYLSQQAQALYEQAVYRTAPLFMLDRTMLADAPQALVRRVLRRWWQEGVALCGLTPEERTLSRADTLALYAFLKETAGKSLNLPLGLTAQTGERFLHLAHQSGAPLRPAEPVAVAVERQRESYELPHMTVYQEMWRGRLPSNASEAVLTESVMALHPVFRTPLPGDTIRPLGAPGEKPLRRFLTDRRIDPALRSALPVLAAGSAILWIPSVCTAEALRVTEACGAGIWLEGTPRFCSIDDKEWKINGKQACDV